MKKILHRGQTWIGLFGPNRTTFNLFVRNNRAIWTRTWKCYLMPFNRPSYEKIVAELQSSYRIDDEGLKSKKKADSSVQTKTVLHNKPQKDKEHLAPLSFLTDAKGLADWELRQQ